MRVIAGNAGGAAVTLTVNIPGQAAQSVLVQPKSDNWVDIPAAQQVSYICITYFEY